MNSDDDVFVSRICMLICKREEIVTNVATECCETGTPWQISFSLSLTSESRKLRKTAPPPLIVLYGRSGYLLLKPSRMLLKSYATPAQPRPNLFLVNQFAIRTAHDSQVLEKGGVG